MENIKTLAGQTVIYGVTNILGRLLNFLLVPLHVYIFTDPAQYGVVGEWYAYVGFLLVLLTYGMETAFFRFIQNKPDKEKVFSTALCSLTITSFLFFVLAIVFSQSIANILNYSQHSEYVRWFAAIVALDAVCSIFFAKLRQEIKAFRFAFVKLSNIAVNILLTLFFLIACPYLLKNNIATNFIENFYHPEIGVGYIFIANLIASVVTLLLFIPVLLKTRLHIDKAILKKMLIYGLPIMFFGLAGIVNETFDRILLKWLSPNDIAQAQVGIYSACYKIAILMTVFIQAFKYAAEPFFFNKSKDKDAKQLYSDVMSIFVLICSVMFLGIMLYIDIVQYFVSSNYRVGLPIVPVLLLANIFLGIFYNLSIWYKLTDKTRFGAYISIGGSCVTLILNYILIPRIGYLGSAWATFACYLFMMLISYFLGQKYYHIDYEIGRILMYVGLAVVFFFLSKLVYVDILWIRIGINTALLLAYLFIIWIKDRKYILMILKR